MLIVGDENDRTGTKLDNENSPVEIEVLNRAKDVNIYLLQTQIKGESELSSGKYFVTGEQLEIMIVGYETGLWIDEAAINPNSN